MNFRITGLALDPFRHLFDLDDEALARHRARRVVADREASFPCRVSLVDAAVGEALILVHYKHLPSASPFCASHAIYVRTDARERYPEPGEVPSLLRSRTLSLRGFDRDDMMQVAELVNGREVEGAIFDLLADPSIAYAHLHYAAPGCFAARVARV
jgi:hypothetical protein